MLKSTDLPAEVIPEDIARLHHDGIPDLLNDHPSLVIDRHEYLANHHLRLRLDLVHLVLSGEVDAAQAKDLTTQLRAAAQLLHDSEDHLKQVPATERQAYYSEAIERFRDTPTARTELDAAVQHERFARYTTQLLLAGAELANDSAA